MKYTRSLTAREIIQGAVFLVGYGNKYRTELISVEARFLWEEWERKGKAKRPVSIPDDKTVEEAKTWMGK